ncbi:unnamed protein product [Lampetra planeri]
MKVKSSRDSLHPHDATTELAPLTLLPCKQQQQHPRSPAWRRCHRSPAAPLFVSASGCETPHFVSAR